MSGNDQKKHLLALRRLRERAAAGDKQAQALLKKVEAAIAGQIAGMLQPPGGSALMLPPPVEGEGEPQGFSEKRRRSKAERDPSNDEYTMPSEGGLVSEDDVEGTPDDIDLADAIEGDGLSAAVQLRNAKRDQRKATGVQHVEINPISIDRGKLGNQQSVWPIGSPNQPINSPTGAPTLDQNGHPITASPPGASGPVELCRWMGEDDETRPVSIILGIVSPIPMMAAEFLNFLPRPYSQIQFGTQGFLQTLYTDYCAGMQFVLPASQVIVQGTQARPFAGTNIKPVQLSAMLSFLATLKIPEITLTVDVDSTCVGTLAAFPPFFIPTVPYDILNNPAFTPGVQLPLLPVPPFARDILFRGTTSIAGGGDTPATKVNILDAGANVIDQFEVPAGPGFGMVEPVPLVNRAAFAQIQSSPGLVVGQIVWGLCF